MVADGKGNVTEAVWTINVGGASTTETCSCTLNVNANGTGPAVCPLARDFHLQKPLASYSALRSDFRRTSRPLTIGEMHEYFQSRYCFYQRRCRCDRQSCRDLRGDLGAGLVEEIDFEAEEALR